MNVTIDGVEYAPITKRVTIDGVEYAAVEAKNITVIIDDDSDEWKQRGTDGLWSMFPGGELKLTREQILNRYGIRSEN